MSRETHEFLVPGESDGTRVDRFLAGADSELSRSRIKALIEDGHLRVDGEVRMEAAFKVRTGQMVELSVPPPRAAIPKPQDIALDVVYEDDELIVVDKPAGLVVHPAAGNPDGTLVNALLAHCGGSLSGIGGVSRPGIVHRLDKDTSGLLVAAKTDRAHRSLSEQFAEHTVERAYKAVVWGVPEPRHGVIDRNIGRSPANRKKMAVRREGGKRAVTHFSVERVIGSRACLVDCRLETGRTHQIRVHLADLGHAVVGDPLYGGGYARLRGAESVKQQLQADFKCQALHAYIIGFSHPVSESVLRFELNLTPYFNELELLLESI